ncbi:MAG: BMP family ABC transporter substrate-binding protein [Alphaproteobacteria bacterium]|nr:BMP family ABC transporter substrate-binding protein [Alphaproteobacteria bacterium]
MKLIRKTIKHLAAATIATAMIAGAASAADKLKIGFVYPSPVGDVGWAYQLDEGRKKLEAMFGDQIETVVVENVPEGPDAARIMNQMASTGAGMIMIGSFGYMNDGLKLASQKPDINFIHASGYKTAANFGNFQTRNYESAYVAGMAAGYASESNTLGVVAAYAIPEVVGIINTFTLGAQKTNPDITVKVVWLNSWFNPSKAQESAKSLIAQSADVIFSLYQDTPSVVSVAEEEGVYVVNTSSDMKKYAPTKLLASMTIDWGPHFVTQVKAALDGTFEGTAYWGGMADDAVGLASLSDDLSAEQKADIQSVMDEIAAGSFHPMTGPIIAQDGSEKIAAGESIDDGAMRGIDWLVAGVETKLPN